MDAPAFGPWIVERPIGRGAFATVYRCRHRDDAARVVAVKVLHAAEPRAVARLGREVRVLRRLGHPGIVGIVDADAEATEPWIALELVDGGPLDRVRPGRRPPAEVAALAREVAAALTHAHGVGVFHRDVKPANLLVERGSGRVRVVDFGVSAARGEATLTAPGAPAPGTMGYAPPEWFEGGRIDPARVDAYGLGAVLHEQLTGASPFGGAAATVAGIMAAKHACLDLDPGPEVPEPLRGAVRALTAADPRRRATLEEALGTLAEAAPPEVRRAPPALVPAPSDPLVGREALLTALAGLSPAVRLVTLSGPPGVGKSRLGREWCARSGPTPWVELGSATDLPGALRAAGRALACPPTLEAVTATLRDGPWATVLLDDADRVLDALREILPAAFRGTPQVRWVVTTRGRLRIGGERVIPVEPLPVPVHDEETAAVALLRSRVREAGGPSPSARRAAEVVRAVDGLPLAIELAASAAPRDDELPGGSPPASGEEGLRPVLASAWSRLPAEARRVLRGCAVFRAPFGLQAAEDVVGAGDGPLFDVLAALCDQSWLQVRRGEGAFAMLRPIRAFAEAEGIPEEVRERHAFAAARPADRASPPTPGEVAEALAAWDVAEAIGDDPLAVLLALVVARGTGAREGGWVSRARALLDRGAGGPEDRERLRASFR
jgi:hypothetical protein